MYIIHNTSNNICICNQKRFERNIKKVAPHYWKRAWVVKKDVWIIVDIQWNYKYYNIFIRLYGMWIFDR